MRLKPLTFVCFILMTLGYSSANGSPEIRCPRIPSVFEVERGHTDVRVIWPVPEVKDPDGGWLTIRLITPQRSGSLFTQGTYTVTYEVEDSEGLKTTCSFSFTVQVKECPALSMPPHGKRYSCTNDRRVGSICWLECDQSSGYAPARGQWTTCSPHQTWNNSTMECVDIERPQIESCPTQTLVSSKDPSSASTRVMWETPITVSDNSGEKIDVTSPSSGVNSTGGMFPEGTTLVKLMAQDSAGNGAEMCAFNVRVEVIECEAPTFDDQYLSAPDCVDFSVGKVCRLQCHLALNLRGPQFIQCKRSTNSAKGFWSYGQDDNPPAEKPHCEVPKCPALRVPNFGALSCSEWDGKASCQLSCRAGYDIPANVATVSLYTCNSSSNTWNSDNVPDCKWREFGDKVRMRSYNYFSGACWAAKSEIKTSFLTVVNEDETCPSERFCTAEHVDVQCGEEPEEEWRK